MTNAFYFDRRDKGHWDIIVPNGGGRIFSIRGEIGNFSVMDYRNAPATQSIGFRTLDSVVLYCMAEMMWEG